MLTCILSHALHQHMHMQNANLKPNIPEKMLTYYNISRKNHEEYNWSDGDKISYLIDNFSDVQWNIVETSVKRAFLIDEKQIKRAGLQGAKLEELPQYVGSSEVRTNTIYFRGKWEGFVVPIFKRNELHFIQLK